ncbi:MAG TPA: hypothetical protein ENI98_10135 [Gammaproteobacteria bacterium]|nr:hypothetical protein [Gammaproteobacteria bacterium]
MNNHTDYNITYLGIGGIDVQEHFNGERQALAEHITIIEENGGQQVTVTDKITARVVYDCGGFVV